MRTMKRFPGVLLAATIAVASTMATALPASAAAPSSCVTVQTSSTLLDRTVSAYNGCSTSKRFKIIWAFAPDGGCASHASGSTFTQTNQIPARFEALQSC